MRLAAASIAALLLAGPVAAEPLMLSLDRVVALRLELPRPSIDIAAAGAVPATFSLACDQAPPMPERTFYPMWDTVVLVLDAEGLDGLAPDVPFGDGAATIGDEVGLYQVKEGSGRLAPSDIDGRGTYALTIQISNNRLTGRVGTEEMLARLADGRAFRIGLPGAGPAVDLELASGADEVASAAASLVAACAAFHRPQ